MIVERMHERDLAEAAVADAALELRIFTRALALIDAELHTPVGALGPARGMFGRAVAIAKRELASSPVSEDRLYSPAK